MQHNNKRLGDVTELTLLSSPLKIKRATNVTPIKNVVAMGCPDYDMTPQQMAKATSPHHVIQHEDISSKLAMRGDDHAETGTPFLPHATKWPTLRP